MFITTVQHSFWNWKVYNDFDIIRCIEAFVLVRDQLISWGVGGGRLFWAKIILLFFFCQKNRFMLGGLEKNNFDLKKDGFDDYYSIWVNFSEKKNYIQFSAQKIIWPNWKSLTPQDINRSLRKLVILHLWDFSIMSDHSYFLFGGRGAFAKITICP